MPWDTVVTDSQLVAIHAALLPTELDGVVVYFGDWSGGGGGVGVQEVSHTRLHHVATGHPDPIETVPLDVVPDTDVFCAGHAFLSDGRLLAAGGTFGWAEAHEGIHFPHYDGERACWIYLPRDNRWTRVADLSFQPDGDAVGGGRWYPTLVTLGNGQVIAIGGHPAADDFYPPSGEQRHNNNTPERYSPGADTWTLLTSDITAPPDLSTDGYPRYHLLPDGRLFSDTAGKDWGNGATTRKRILDPFTGSWTGDDVGGLDLLPGFYDRGSAATSVLLPLLPPHYPVRILACNSPDDTAFHIDVDGDLNWHETAPRTGSAAGRDRTNACATLLPTGQILVTGGWPGNAQASDPDTATLEPELYTPGIDWDAGDFSNTGDEEWETIEEPAPNRRGYHSTALLLPDGRVWHGGSTTTAEPLNREIDLYSPAYVGQAGRPTITSAPTNISYATPFDVTTPDAQSIARVALVRNGSMTHGFNTDQRYVGLTFSTQGTDTLRVAPPPNSRIAPPGYYMLWLIDDQGLPCERAAFVRVSDQKLFVTADISTYSIHEVDALGTPATFQDALYVVADGFLPSEVSTPTHVLLYTDNEEVPGVSITFGAPKYEGGSQADDVAQRIVYPVHVTFTSTAAFDDIPADQDFRTIVFYAQMGLFTGFVQVQLSKNPNPRMSDGDPHWLSVDLRVFKTNPSDTFTAGISHPPAGDGEAGTYGYIQDLIDTFNGWDTGTHPFDDLPTDQAANRLELASHDVDGEPVYNYALARVRFRAPEGIDAADVRVFFRMWTTGWTALEYDTSASYRRNGDGPGATPLLGLLGGEVNNVPCFAEPRAADMTAQSDIHNRRTLQGSGAAEVHGYFGAWLDINQDVPRFPLAPTHNGPFTDADDPEGLKSIQQLMRGLHHCLVAEIHYTLDPTPTGATPGSSDNLAQRNILFDDSDNPGGFASHLVHHTLEIEPSPVSFAQTAEAHLTGGTTSAARLHNDELAIDWGGLPRDSLVSLYVPQVNATELVLADGQRQAAGNLRASGPGTVAIRVSDVGFVPVPGPLTDTLASLLSVQLPPGIPAGKTYRVVVRQVDGRRRRVLGTTELRIRVGHAEDLLPKALHNLSVLRHVALAIPAGHRWELVFERYVRELEERIRAFGGDPDTALPSPTGHPGPIDHDEEGDRRPHGCASGRIRRLVYDCFGAFEGFDLVDCDEVIRIASHEQGVERVVLTACDHDLAVTVHFDEDTRRARRLWLNCRPSDHSCEEDRHAPSREDAPRGTVAARRPRTGSRQPLRRRLPQPPRWPIDPEHGGDERGGGKPPRHDH